MSAAPVTPSSTLVPPPGSDSSDSSCGGHDSTSPVSGSPPLPPPSLGPVPHEANTIKKIEKPKSQKKLKVMQKTLTSIFAVKKAFPEPHPPPLPPASEEACPPAVPEDSLPPPPVQLTLPEEGSDHSLCFDIPQQELTEVERFQQRLDNHMKAKPHAPREKPSSIEEGGVAGMLSKETITKLSETPGEQRKLS